MEECLWSEQAQVKHSCLLTAVACAFSHLFTRSALSLSSGCLWTKQAPSEMQECLLMVFACAVLHLQTYKAPCMYRQNQLPNVHSLVFAHAIVWFCYSDRKLFRFRRRRTFDGLLVEGRLGYCALPSPSSSSLPFSSCPSSSSSSSPSSSSLLPNVQRQCC